LHHRTSSPLDRRSKLTHIVSGSDDKTIRVWNAVTGNLIGAPLKGHTGHVTSVAYSPDGRHIVSGSVDKTIRVWNSETRYLMGAPLEGHTDWVNSVAYSPDGRHIVSGSDGKTIRVWNADTRDFMEAPLGYHISGVSSVVCSPDGRQIVSASDDTTIQVLNAKTTHFAEEHLYSNSVVCRSIANPSHAKYAGSSGMSMQTSTPIPVLTWRSNMVNGWIYHTYGSKSELLFWVPPNCRPGLLEPNNTILIGALLKTRLDVSRFVHGSHWTRCAT
jgi:WD40 repeat protein